ncbi:hypothetical protein [Pseudoduganella violaceinigra]|uniref:hypothetical protein n=1 Tax=Pseudoduganella violaceinigra TaxID=246602 RepID=UPI00041D60E1|nr:hypothetical protein [Pseudoduganella violaceinigra]
MALALNIAIILLALVTLYFLLKGGPKMADAPVGKPAGGSYTPLPQGEPVHHWTDEGRFQLEVLGESRYSDTIRELAGEHGDGAADTRLKALLLADDNNPYEDKAVAVFLNSEMVGYLAPKDAMAFRTMLARQAIPGQLTSTDAVIRGGQLYQGKRLSYTVLLDVNVA